jgi:GR25 family glycosyltransferase involved in LPS biosynthesis
MLFNAIDGYTLDESIWSHLGLKIPKKKIGSKGKFSDAVGAQGCFLSHYTLWNLCVELNEPIIVLEDDATVLGPIPSIVTDQDLIKLHDPRACHYNKKLGSWAAGAFAYWISPAGAKKLINFSISDRPGHVDKLIGSKILNWDYLTPPIVELGPRRGSSTNPEKYPYPLHG